jgi:hypothetical protein
MHDQDSFSLAEIREMFKSKAILNYMNDVVMNMVDMYLQMVEVN